MRAGPIVAALGGLLLVALAGTLHDPQDDVRHRSELTARINAVAAGMDSLEQSARYLRPTALRRPALADDVVEAVHVPSYSEPDAITAPEGVKIEEQSLSARPYPSGTTFLTRYKVTNTRATPVTLRVNFDYCTADDFVVEKRNNSLKLAPGEQRTATDELSFAHGPISKVDIRAEETQ